MPHLRLGVRISRTSHLLTMVRKGELCSALITEVDDMERFYSREVYVDQLGFFVSAQHPIAQLGWGAVREFGLGSLAPGKDGLPRYFSRFLRQLGGAKPTVLSDSFEALKTAAQAGVLVSVLPRRVARRLSSGEGGLLEIFPDGSKNKELGRHRILVVSQANCDTEEVDFLADETARILQNS
jgi:DNA-binding transcriptional LysR family regulator